VQPYYILPWILAQNDRLSDAKSVARDGVVNNPKSGLLLMSYAQLLAIRFNDWVAAAPYAERAMRSDTYWAADVEQWESLRIAEDVFNRVGDTARANAAAAVLSEIAARTGGTRPADALGEDHDHNGDGVADH
jgi:predicted Zn-dependent protease